MRAALTALAVLATSFTWGCGPNCQSTCTHLYETCAITRTGRNTDELLRDCNTICDNALREPGELGDYTPNAPRNSAEAATLDNERQAAAWMDCVWLLAPDGTPDQCAVFEPANGAYCAPI